MLRIRLNIISSMTIWDKIYKNFKNGGEAWATLGQDIHPFFEDFLRNIKPDGKTALDIGCGDGRYLKILQNLGYKVVGVDSSETAIEMSKNILDNDSDLVVADIFNFEIPKGKFDLIISIKTIQHSSKEDISKLIDNIYQGIVVGGRFFGTLPNISVMNKWHSFKNSKVIGQGVVIPTQGPEKGLIHSFFGRDEVSGLFSKFKKMEMQKDDRQQWVIRALK